MQASSSEEDLFVIEVIMPPVPPILPKILLVMALSNSENDFLPVSVVVRLACNTLAQSVLIIAKEAEPIWPVVLIKKKDWPNKKVVKSTLYRELAS